MEMMTEDGIKFYCLPIHAVCRQTGMSPEQMDECPLCKFDALGLKCVPELCEEYSEEE